MGAHHAPAHVARHTRPAHASSTTPGLRLGRLAGRGVLATSAALALTGAGSGAALAHDADTTGGLLAGNDSSLLCGILGGERCSSDDAGSSADTDDASSSVFDHVDATDRSQDTTDSADTARDDARASTEERAARTTDGRDAATASQPSTGDENAGRSAAQPQASQIDTPPPPGQVRTINLPN